MSIEEERERIRSLITRANELYHALDELGVMPSRFEFTEVSQDILEKAHKLSGLRPIRYERYSSWKLFKSYMSGICIDTLGIIMLLLAFITLAYNALIILYETEIPIGRNPEFGMVIQATFFLPGLLFSIIFYVAYIIYDWLPALYGLNIIRNLIDFFIGNLIDPFVNSYVNPSLLHFDISKITLVRIPFTDYAIPAPILFYIILPAIGTTLSYVGYFFTDNIYYHIQISNRITIRFPLVVFPPMTLYFFTILGATFLIIKYGTFSAQVIIFVLAMQYLILFIIYKAYGSLEDYENLNYAFFIAFLVPFLPWLLGIGYLILFTAVILKSSLLIDYTEEMIKVLLTNRQYESVLDELIKTIKKLEAEGKIILTQDQQNLQSVIAQSQVVPQQSAATQTTTQQTPTAPQQTNQTPQQTTTQQTQTTPQINQPSQPTAPQLQSTQQDTKTASQQIPQMISSQPASQQQTTQQPSVKQIPQQQATSQVSRQRLQHTPRADMLISNFEKALNQVKNIKGDSSEIYYKSIVLTYHSIIGIYLRKIYYGEPLKYHHLIQYFMVRGLISEELGKTLLELSRKNWRLQNDPSFTANRELMLETMNATYQLLNELKNKKELLEKLLIEKKAHGGKLRL